MSRLLDLKGRRFGKLFVLERVESYRKIPRWLCQCDCGKTRTIRGAELRYGKTKTCGCRNVSRENNPFYRHGMTAGHFWRKWYSVKQRCLNKSSSTYYKYGAKGISIPDKWIGFDGFREDMEDSYLSHVEEYGEKETTLDRVDPFKSYSKENCRWATNRQQARNKTNTRFLTFEGKTLPMSEWAEIRNISIDVIEQRINKLKWPVEDALTRPIRKMSKRLESRK